MGGCVRRTKRPIQRRQSDRHSKTIQVEVGKRLLMILLDWVGAPEERVLAARDAGIAAGARDVRRDLALQTNHLDFLELLDADDAVLRERRAREVDPLAQRRALSAGPRLRVHGRAGGAQLLLHLGRRGVDEEERDAQRLCAAASLEAELEADV